MLTDVSRSYGAPQALKSVSLALAAGQCVALPGVNGSGKSALLRIAAGRDTPTSGRVSYLGQPLREDALAECRLSDEPPDLSRRRRGIGGGGAHVSGRLRHCRAGAPGEHGRDGAAHPA